MERNGGIRITASTTNSSSGSRLRAEMLNAVGQRLASLVGADLGVGVGGAAEQEERDQADRQRGTGRPDHVPYVLPDRQAATDELRRQDRGLRQRRHLVAEVGPADDRSGGDRLVQAEHVAHSDERDAQGPRRRPRAAGHHAHDGAHQGRRDVEPARADDPDAVVDDGGDGPGHVPGADQGTDRQQDEDGAHRDGHATHGRLGHRRDSVAVLEGDQAGERGAQQQRDLQRPVGGAHPEQDDRQGEQGDQDDDRQQGVEEAGGLGRAVRRRRLAMAAVTAPRRSR